MPAWYKKLLTNNTAAINLAMILIAVYIIYLLVPALSTIFSYLFQILIPFFLALILYYLVRPFVYYLKPKITLYGAIAVTYLLLIAFFVFLILFIYPTILEQIELFKNFSMDNIVDLKDKTIYNFYNYKLLLPDELKASLSKFFTNLNSVIVSSVVTFISTLTQFIISFLISLLILFYLLKDDKKLHVSFIQKIPEKYQVDVEDLIDSIDRTLMHFINGRIVVALITGVLTLIAFFTIGLNYAVILSLISFIFYIIPTIGSFLAMILPLIVGFSTSAFLGFEVLVLMTLVISIEGFLVSPEVMGKHLYMHPLTNILLLLISGTFYGIWGLLFITPAYIVLKIIAIHLYRFIEDNYVAPEK